MIEIVSIQSDDTDGSVTLAINTDSTTVSIYRQVGLAPEREVSSEQDVTLLDTQTVNNPDGTVSTYYIWIDSPGGAHTVPQKALLSYVAVSDTYERSQAAQIVLPRGFSLTRPSLAGDIRLGDMVFNTIDDDGTVWTITDIAGWWNLPDASVPTANKSKYEDGSYDENGRFVARALTLTGMFLPVSSEAIDPARSRLVQAFNSVREPVQLRLDQDPPRQMTVRLSGKTDITTLRQSGLSSFSAELQAADPLKYSLDAQTVILNAAITMPGWTYPRTGGRAYGLPPAPSDSILTNLGDTSAPTFITIYGPVTNPHFEIVNTGEFASFLIILADGQYLEIDSANKSVLLNGSASRRGAMTLGSSWISLPPGDNYLRFTAQAATPTTSAQVTSHSVWIG